MGRGQRRGGAKAEARKEGAGSLVQKELAGAAQCARCLRAFCPRPSAGPVASSSVTGRWRLATEQRHIGASWMGDAAGGFGTTRKGLNQRGVHRIMPAWQDRVAGGRWPRARGPR